MSTEDSFPTAGVLAPPLRTTRMTRRFAEHLAELRRYVSRLPESPLRESLEARLDFLGGDLAMGFPVLEQVEVPRSPGEEVRINTDFDQLPGAAA